MNGDILNDAHIVLAQYRIPVMTMNIDGLHKFAERDVLELYGEDNQMDRAYCLYNKSVLYGDYAPNYQKGYEMVYWLELDDIFLAIGCSFYTGISLDLSGGARIITGVIIKTLNINYTALILWIYG